MPRTFTRADWQARTANGGPGTLDPARVVGVALHWPAMAKPLDTATAVCAALRSWQAFHMDDRGWSDIAYQLAFDQAGNRYELRGLRTQSGANGDTEPNETHGAFLLVLAPGEEPSDAMVAAVRAAVADHRRLFPRSTRIVGHSDIRPEPTACPGPAALAAIRAGRFNPLEDDMPYLDWPEKDRNALVADILAADVGDDRTVKAALRMAAKAPAAARDLERTIVERLASALGTGDGTVMIHREDIEAAVKDALREGTG